MLRMETITKQSYDLEKIKAFYERAFPINERMTLAPIIEDESDKGVMLGFYDESLFVGFACLLTYQDITHILYFAIEESLRNQGYGKKALQLMHDLYPHHRFIADIEKIDEGAQNSAIRHKRKKFYQEEGYVPSGVEYFWEHESYEVMVCGGTLTEKEYEAFWEAFAQENDDDLN